jgi:hypothetical protein
MFTAMVTNMVTVTDTLIGRDMVTAHWNGHSAHWNNNHWRHGHGRWYGGRWWGYGVGSCWSLVPGGYVWICG